MKRESEKTQHSAISDEPDACCYADHRELNGERRARRRGGEVWTPVWIESSTHRSGRSTRRCERSWLPWKKEKKKKPWSNENSTGIPSDLLILEAWLSQRDSASFITFSVSMCMCAIEQRNSLLIGTGRLLPTVGQLQKAVTIEKEAEQWFLLLHSIQQRKAHYEGNSYSSKCSHYINFNRSQRKLMH